MIARLGGNFVWMTIWAAITLAPMAYGEQLPRVAVFDPVKGTAQTRFSVDLAAHDRAAAALRDAGVAVDRLTAEQIADPTVFGAQRYDAVVFGGAMVPRSNIEAIKRFADEGGVVIAMGDAAPFLIATEPGADGLWQMSPMEPRFAWQTYEVMGHFGVKYIYDATRHDQGKRFTATPLLKHYLPEAADPAGPLPHLWIVPTTVNGEQGVFYPLIRAQRVDGTDVSPQVFLAQRGKRRAIFCLNALFTDGSRPQNWAHSDALVVAMARLAHDLKTGQLQLSEDMRVDIPADLAPPQPLRTRLATGEVDPEGATPIVRWGRFDGSSMDLEDSALPPMLASGESVALDLSALSLPDGPVFLRVRAAYNRTHAGLSIRIDGTTLINETYVYNDPSGESNHTINQYSGLPVEFQRLAFVPARGRTLTISNPGMQPIYFDAVQIETRTTATPERWTGPGGGMSASYGKPFTVPPEVSQRWSILRCGIRTQYVGPPGDPARWDRVKQIMDGHIQANARLNFIFEGTPEWAAISPQRYEEGVKAKRPHVVPPDPRKYAEIVEWVVDNCASHIAVYELWNETDIKQFWRGTPDEYVAFAGSMIDVIQRKDPGKPIMFAGLAHADSDYLQQTRSSDVAKRTSLVPLHPYAGESVSWDVPYGKMQGTLYAMGDATEVYCNESGFVWHNFEWFKSNWTPQKQHDALSAAMGRLLSGDIAKLSMFNAGGDDHPYSLYDAQGNPRPAATVLEDYVTISQPGARRLDAAVVPADGDVPLTGVYVAGSVYPDGSVAFVVNPAESPHARRRVRLTWPTTTPATSEATLIVAGQSQRVAVTHGQGWSSVELDAAARTVVQVGP